MKVIINPGTGRGTVSVPPSKSYAHRMIISAALADGKSIIRGVKKNEDVLATLDCIEALGASRSLNGDTLEIYGVGGKKGFLNAEGTERRFPCRESGSTLRFLIPVSLVFGKKALFSGSERLMERGVGVYENIFKEKGIICRRDGAGLAFSGELTPGEYTLPGNVSSQFVSGLMFALPLLDGDSVIKILPPVESRSYIDITVDVLKEFGVAVTETEENTFTISGGQRYGFRETRVEGDWSNGAALLALAALSDGQITSVNGQIKVTGLNEKSLQGDRRCMEILEKLSHPGATVDISDCPDLGPIMFAFAAAKHGAVFTGTKRLKIKESDRAAAMAEEIAKFGIDVTVEESSVTVHAGELKSPSGVCRSHNDHRIVMALALLGGLVGCEIEGAEAISKSYPEFFGDLISLGMDVII